MSTFEQELIDERADGKKLLAQWLCPVTADDFLDRYWRRQMLHIDRPLNDGYYHLFPWERLNQVLDQHPMLPPRMKLFQKGSQLSFREYLSTDQSGHDPRLRRDELRALLAKGASLILDHADEVHPPLRQALSRLESLFRIPIQANLYAAWKKDEGFTMHWDEQDAFILQVAGRKLWTIHSPTAEAPIKCMQDEPPRPGSEPFFKRVIHAGECLYIPRGWWHAVEAVGEPTLHLTITCQMPTGMVFMRWLMGRLPQQTELRGDVPLFGDVRESECYMPMLANALVAELSNPQLLKSFWNWSELRAAKFGELRLPDLEDQR